MTSTWWICNNINNEADIENMRKFRFTSEQLESLKSDCKSVNWESMFNFDVFPFIYCKSHAYTVHARDAPRKVGRLREPTFNPMNVVGIDKMDSSMDLITLLFDAINVLFFVDIDIIVGQIVYIGIHRNQNIMCRDSIFESMRIWELSQKIILIQTAGGRFTNMVTGNPVQIYELNDDRKFTLARFQCHTYCSMSRHDRSNMYDNIPLFLAYTSVEGFAQMRVAYYDIELGSIFLGDLFYSTDVWNPCSMRRTELPCSKYGHESVYDILYCQEGGNNYDTVFTQSDNYVRSQWQRINVEPLFKVVRQGISDFCNTIAKDMKAFVHAP
jgi:hypothetical protein